MTTSQKYADFSLVPWYNSDEWKKVYSLIYNNGQFAEALNILYLWKNRIDLLPGAVEGTMCILEGLVADLAKLTERQYCILCSSCVMRFLNICVASRTAVNTFTRTAKQNSIPDWIINLRHDIAHSQKLPRISVLKLALQHCFEWLKNTYWIPENLRIRDFIITPKNTNSTNENTECKMEKQNFVNEPILLVKYTRLIKSLYERKAIDEELMKEFEIGAKNDVLKNVFTQVDSNVDVSNLGKHEFEEIISNCFSVHPNSLIAERREIYIAIEKVINFLYKHNHLKEVVLYAAFVMNDNLEYESTRISTAFWLDHIFKGLAKLLHGKSQDSCISFTGTQHSTIRRIINLKYHLFSVSDKITNICFNSFLELSTGHSSDGKKYLKDISVNPQVIFSTIDIDDCGDIVEQMDFEEGDITLQSQSFTDDTPYPTEEEVVRKRRWTVVKDTSQFEKCALGVLPSCF